MHRPDESRSLRPLDLIEEIRRALREYSVTIAELDEAAPDMFGEVWVELDDPDVALT